MHDLTALILFSIKVQSSTAINVTVTFAILLPRHVKIGQIIVKPTTNTPAGVSKENKQEQKRMHLQMQVVRQVVRRLLPLQVQLFLNTDIAFMGAPLHLPICNLHF